MKKWKYIELLTGLFVSVLIVSNIVSTKLVSFWGFTFDGGTIIFPLSYIFGDVLTEVYGYANSRRIIWIGFISSVLMSIIIFVVGIIPSAPDWQFQSSYNQILGITPRIVLASIAAYLAGEFSNSFILSKLKIATKGKYLWVRTIGSTIVGQLFDTLLFVIIAFYGIYDFKLLSVIIISNYIFKTGIEALFTPITYKIVNYLKKEEDINTFDSNTDFNPFKI